MAQPPVLDTAALRGIVRAMSRLSPICLVCLAACASIPEVPRTDATISGPEGYPSLVPLTPLLAIADTPRVEEDFTDALDARANALRARGSALRPARVDAVAETDLRNRADILRGDADDIDALRDELAAAGS